MNNERHGLGHIAQIGPKILNSILLPLPLKLLKLCRHTHLWAFLCHIDVDGLTV